MIATGTTLGCGMSLMIALWTADTEAGGLPAAQSYRFGDHVVVVQPGPSAAPLVPAPSTEPESGIQQARFGDDVPQPSSVEVVPVSPGSPGASAEGLDLARRYRAIYSAIPFDRAEYEANPSYRHEAAMEMLFGKQRPTVVHRNHTQVDVNVPDMPFVRPPYHPYGFNAWYHPYFSPGYRVHRSF
jgi:hypothetical protein